MNFEFVKEVFDRNDVQCKIEDDKFFFVIDDKDVEVFFNDGYDKAISAFSKSRQYEFDFDKRLMLGYRTVEVFTQRLNQNIFEIPSFEFKSNSSKTVLLSRATKEFSLSHFRSEDYNKFFQKVVKAHLARSVRRGHVYFHTLLWNPYTIKYNLERKVVKEKMLNDALNCFESCLFKLAVDKGQAWQLFKERRSLSIIYTAEDNVELNIPFANYDINLVNYYKVAVSSQFPSQSFLSFYHVLEYNFLSVSEEELQAKLRSNIQSTHFSGSLADIESIINTVKKHNDKSDEKDMLVRVLKKYIEVDELRAFIEKFEESTGERYYTKSQKIFGENLSINIKNEHTIPNTANVLKHIRNALVHSSDKYNREDCHIPLTESEELVSFYVPLVCFLAEKIICAK